MLKVGMDVRKQILGISFHLVSFSVGILNIDVECMPFHRCGGGTIKVKVVIIHSSLGLSPEGWRVDERKKDEVDLSERTGIMGVE